MTRVEVGALVASDDGASPFVLERGFAGWFDGPTSRSSATPRQGAHGSFPERAWRTGRLVSVPVAGQFASAAEAEDARDLLASVLADGEFGELAVTSDAGRLTFASVRIEGQPLIDVRPWSGVVRGLVQFFAPDPRRLSIPTLTTSPLPERIGGLEWPLFGLQDDAATGFLEWGPRGDTGRRTLTNVGTAPAYPVATVTGPLPAGFTLTDVGTGRAVSWAGSLSDGEVVVVDFSPAERSVLLSGSDRTHLLSRAQWWEVPPGSSVQAAFTAPSGSGTVSWSLSSAWW